MIWLLLVVQSIQKASRSRAASNGLVFLLSHHIRLYLLLLFSLNLGLHVADETVNISIVNLVLSHLHGVLDHLVYELESFLFGGIGLHVLVELLDVDFILGAAHDVGHSVHDVSHLVHGGHRLQSTLPN